MLKGGNLTRIGRPPQRSQEPLRALPKRMTLELIWKSADTLHQRCAACSSIPKIDSVFLLYRIGVFATCAATLIAASALIWLTHLTIRNPFVTRGAFRDARGRNTAEQHRLALRPFV